jgi:hypothetical protein
MVNINLELKIKLIEIASLHSGGSFKGLVYNYRELIDLLSNPT